MLWWHQNSLRILENKDNSYQCISHLAHTNCKFCGLYRVIQNTSDVTPAFRVHAQATPTALQNHKNETGPREVHKLTSCDHETRRCTTKHECITYNHIDESAHEAFNDRHALVCHNDCQISHTYKTISLSSAKWLRTHTHMMKMWCYSRCTHIHAHTRERMNGCLPARMMMLLLLPGARGDRLTAHTHTHTHTHTLPTAHHTLTQLY